MQPNSADVTISSSSKRGGKIHGIGEKPWPDKTAVLNVNIHV